MATRGCYGFYKNGESKITYNHFDSYPSGLGKSIFKFIKSNSIEDLNFYFDNLILVEEKDFPNDYEKKTLDKLDYLYQYKDEKLNWFQILGSTLGDLDVLNEGLFFFINANDFIKESLFCEWGYIINLDTNELEIYKGFQKEPNYNRYHIDTPSKSGYYNCKLIKSISLDDIYNSNNFKTLLKEDE